MTKKILLTIIMVLFCSSASAVDYCADANNKGCWGMEDSTTENDLSSNNEDLTVSSGDTIEQSVDKKFGTYSRNFEADDADALEHAEGGSTDISGADQAITMVGWVQPETTTGSDYVMSKYDIGNNQRQLALIATAQPSCVLSPTGTSGSGEAIAATTMSAGTSTWYHLACVYNDTDIRMYVNGVLDSNGANNPFTYSSGIFDGSADFCVGCSRNNGAINAVFDGLLDDLAIFDRALSAEEIADIYTNGLQGATAFSGTQLTSDNQLTVDGQLTIGN